VLKGRDVESGVPGRGERDEADDRGQPRQLGAIGYAPRPSPVAVNEDGTPRGLISGLNSQPTLSTPHTAKRSWFFHPHGSATPIRAAATSCLRRSRDERMPAAR
jgi:hypothetical protein